MPEDNNCKLVQSSRTSDKKRKKKRQRKKAIASTTPPENIEKPQVVSLPPETSPVSPLSLQCLGQPRGRLPKPRTTNKKDDSGRRSKKHLEDSPPLRANEISRSAALGWGNEDELSAQTRESLRWEGVLEDAQAEEKRLELYRANRRQRYISHREALLKEIQYAFKQTFPNESKDEEDLIGTDQQEQSAN